MDWFFLRNKDYERMRREAKQGLVGKKKKSEDKTDYNFGVSRADLERYRKQSIK